MPRQPIPERAPIGDAFSGVILGAQGKHFLAFEAQPDAEVQASGDFVLRYGVRYLGKPHLSIVPGLVALDYGDMLTGEDAWDFVLKKSNLHPRADVIGYRNDGLDEMIVVKWLDLALKPEVLVYESASATVPLAKPRALIAPDALELDRQGVPLRLRGYLPCYPSVGVALAEES